MRKAKSGSVYQTRNINDYVSSLGQGEERRGGGREEASQMERVGAEVGNVLFHLLAYLIIIRQQGFPRAGTFYRRPNSNCSNLARLAQQDFRENREEMGVDLDNNKTESSSYRTKPNLFRDRLYRSIAAKC